MRKCVFISVFLFLFVFYNGVPNLAFRSGVGGCHFVVVVALCFLRCPSSLLLC